MIAHDRSWLLLNNEKSTRSFSKLCAFSFLTSVWWKSWLVLASWREVLWRGLQTRSIFFTPREKSGKLEKNASVRGCVGRVVGMWCLPSTWPWCPRTWSAGLPPPGSSGPRLLRWQRQTVLSVPGGQPRFLRHDGLSNCPH